MRIASSIVVAAALAATSARVETVVHGTVVTADGAKVLGATVWILGATAPGDSGIAATTDESGAYRFSLPLGAARELLVRRRGFVDVRVPLGPDAAAKRTLTLPPVTLAARVEPLARAVVPDTGAFTGYAAPFFRRLVARHGDFVTRADLQRLKPTRVSSVLRSIPGVTLEITGGSATYVRLRGNRCYASLWLDGASVGGGRTFDVDAIAPASLLGIEVYAYPSALPIEYQMGDAASCGVVALWTRRGDDGTEDALEPATVPDPASVRLASEVDTPARLADGVAYTPRYPGAARAEGTAGTALVELVVDTAGAVERGTVGVVAASAPDLGGAAVQAASRLKFAAARDHGRPVRQLVHLVADFRSAARDKR